MFDRARARATAAMASAQPDPSRASDAPIDRGIAALGDLGLGLLRSISRAVSRGGGDADARTNDPEPAPAIARTLSRRDTMATKLNEDAVRADADAKMKSEMVEKLAREREREEANASDDEDEDEDEGFRMKRKEEDAAVPAYTWTATLRRRVRELEEGADVEAREAERLRLDEALGAADDEDADDVSTFVNGAPTVITKMKSRINSMNAPTGPTGVLVKTAHAEDKPMQQVVEDSYYKAVMSEKLPAYKAPRRHIARLENLESAVLDKEGNQLPLWKSTSDDLDVLGPGISLWFAQLKTLGKTFVYITMLASVALSHYVYIANKSSSVEVEPEITTTLGVTAAGVYASAYGIDIRTIMAVLSCLDVCMVLMFMLITAILSRRIRSFVVRVDEALLTLADYSLQVTGLPVDATEDEVREHFEEFGPVADVVIARSYGAVLRARIHRARLFKRAEQLKSELSAIRHTLKKRGEDYNANYAFKRKWKQFYKARDKMNALKEKIEQRMLEPFNIVYAFITFEQESDKMTCLDEYAPYFNFFRSKRTRFRVHPREDGKGDTFHYLRVAQAVEASDIMWENMANVGWKQYFVRRAITTIAILGLLIGNIILVVFATDWVKSGGRLLVNCGDLFASGASDNMYCPAIWNINENSLETDLGLISNVNFRKQVESSDCNPFIESAMWSYDMTQYSPYYEAVGAYSSLSVSSANAYGYSGGVWNGGMDASTKADECAAKICYDCMCESAIRSGRVTTICKDYFYDQLLIFGFEVGRLSVVALTSMLLLWTSGKFALFERHKTVSATEKTTSRFAFFTLITNALILPLLVNIEIKGFSGFPILFRGSYEDVTLDWYALVMRSLMITTFINASWFGPSRLVQMWLTQLWRYWTARWCTTQYNLNRLYQRPKFTLAERYGQCMTVIFTAIVLFAAAPVLVPVAAFYCFLAYWSDKTMILRHSRYPSLYDHKLARQFMSYAPLACLAHFAFSSWAFSQWDIPSYFLTGLDGWAEEIYDQRDSDFWTVRANMTKYEQLDFKERFYRVNGLIQLIPLMAYFIYLLIKAFFSSVGNTALYLLGCKGLGASEWKADVQFSNFSEARDNMLKDGDHETSLSGLPSYRVQDNPEYTALFPEAKQVHGAFISHDDAERATDAPAPASTPKWANRVASPRK